MNYADVVFIKEDVELAKLKCVVIKAVEDFMRSKDNIPTRLFFNNEDFDIVGEIEVCGYKVRTTNLVPKGEVIIMDDTPLTIYDRF